MGYESADNICNPFCCVLLKINPMKIIISERSVTLWAFPLPRVISCLQTFETEHVKAFGQDGVLLTCITTRTRQLRLQKKRQGNKQKGRWTKIKITIISCIFSPCHWQKGQHVNCESLLIYLPHAWLCPCLSVANSRSLPLVIPNRN